MFAQTTITGTVVADDGYGIPGATVRVKGSTEGTITDLDGNYTLAGVPSTATTLVFSFVGLETKDVEIAGQKVINVTLKSTDLVVEEVVVTAIGIKKSEKKIGYAATTVNSEELTASKDRSALNALQGKVAGVNISAASGSPGASSRVIFRGFSTLSGSNQPLYVIDGMPINNSSSGSSSLNGGTDFGNQANDINPDDIASITFLKGSAATALYGSRASSGVIVITTKKGSEKKGMQINASSTVKFSTPLRLPQQQDVYGQGIKGSWDQRENTSFGPKFDHQMHYWGHVVDNKRLIKPYEAIDNVADFFEVGKTFQSVVSLSGGSEGTTYYLSYSNINDDGIMPYDKDTYNRNTVSLTGQSQLSDKISSTASFNYINKKNKFVPTGQSGGSVWNNVLQQPRDIPILELANYKEPFFNNDTYYGPYTTNPYWPLLENGNKNNSDRVYGVGEMTFAPDDHFSFLLRAGTDVSNDQTKEWVAKKINSSTGYNFGVDDQIGSVSELSRLTTQLNTDFIATYVNKIGGNLDLSVLFGHNLNQRAGKTIYTRNTGINVEGFYHLSNTSGIPSSDEYSYIRRLVGVYSSVELNFKGYLNLALTARNDWSSTLPQANNSFFYPGVSLGFVFSDAVPALKKLMTYGKLRTSWGQTGKDTSPYNIYSVFNQSSFSDGFGSLTLPLPNGVNGFSVGNALSSLDLQPELTTEFEIGTDIRFFQNRLSFDITYYTKSITNLIFDVPFPASTGYTYQTTNLGEIQNKGLEFLVTATPIDKKNFSWDISFNFANNRSKLVSLKEGLDNVPISGLSNSASMWAEPGKALFVFTINEPMTYTDGAGQVHYVVNANGVPFENPNKEEYIGKSEYDFISGAGTTLNFLGFSVSATIDWRKGGIMYSRTAGMMYFTGTGPQTLYNDRQPFIVPNSVVQVGTDASGNPIYKENTIAVLPSMFGGSSNSFTDVGGTLVGKQDIIDKTFIKLRSLSIVYQIPSKIVKKTTLSKASVSMIGSNLLLWTPASNNFIDPEATTFTDDKEADYGEFGASPSVRTIGFSISLTF